MFSYIPPPNNGLSVLYKDSSLLALNKPSGLLSVPGRGADKQDCLMTRVQAEYPEALIVHRLDMSTSGIMLLARNKRMQSQLSRLFQERRVNKRYIAVVAGKLATQWGELNLPLITDWPNRPRQKVDFIQGKASCTQYRVLAYDVLNNTTRVALKPITGRSHQLRVHMLALGHPILGDELYASVDIEIKAKRLLLHATSIEFQHPATQQLIAIESDVPF